jgi:hypothetical protein
VHFVCSNNPPEFYANSHWQNPGFQHDSVVTRWRGQLDFKAILVLRPLNLAAVTCPRDGGNFASVSKIAPLRYSVMRAGGSYHWMSIVMRFQP